MKYCALLIATVLTGLLLTGCSKNGGEVQVVSAVYGNYTNFADVTFRVRDLLQLHTGFLVQPDYLQADPFPYYHKALVIVYDVKGRRHLFTAFENDPVSATIILQSASQ